MVKSRQRRATTDLRYIAKLFRVYKGIGLPEDYAKSLAILSALERNEKRGAIHMSWNIMKNILSEHNIDKIFWGQYYAFVNAYISKMIKGKTSEAEQVVRNFIEKGLSATIIRQFLDRVGEVLSEPTETP